MYIVTVTQIRPLPITPFFIFPSESVQLVEEFKVRGKLLEVTNTLSEDMLTRTAVWKWADRDSAREFHDSPIQVENRAQQEKYNEITGIVKTIVSEEM